MAPWGWSTASLGPCSSLDDDVPEATCKLIFTKVHVSYLIPSGLESAQDEVNPACDAEWGSGQMA